MRVAGPARSPIRTPSTSTAEPVRSPKATPANVARNVVRTAKIADTVPLNRDGLLTWGELNASQQHLFGVDGAKTYAKLSSDDRAVFLLLTRRMDRNGVDYSGLTLKDPLETIRRNRLLFNPDTAGLARFKASLEKGLSEDKMFTDVPFEPFHKGMADWGVRENRRKWTTQYGIGSGGAFVDVDRYNYKADWKAYLGHTAEILDPRKPSPLKIAEELDEDLSSKLRSVA